MRQDKLQSAPREGSCDNKQTKQHFEDPPLQGADRLRARRNFEPVEQTINTSCVEQVHTQTEEVAKGAAWYSTDWLKAVTTGGEPNATIEARVQDDTTLWIVHRVYKMI